MKPDEIDFDKLNLIPVREAAERYLCSVRHLARKAEQGKFLMFGGGKERTVDTNSADAWYLSTLVGNKEERGVRRGAPRKR